ncbi:MAG TPA: metallophosphoesterase [Kiritimatiellia bacterium]|nr:metallophosphoesterase [Kiritimatiellia bacterium]
MRTNRRQFLAGALAACATPLLGKRPADQVTKFLFMADTHVESDFMERGKDCYAQWKTGNHAALVKTYEFINTDPYCRDAQFALFGGDLLNTGYSREQPQLDAEREIYFRTLATLELHSKSAGTDLSWLKFRSPAGFLCRENLGPGQKPVQFTYPALNSRVIAIQGNHDTGVPEFYRECAFECGGTRFICFFASYVGLPAAPGTFRSTGAISDESLAFVANEMKAAAADPEIQHIVLVSHWSLVQGDKNFSAPILDACKENKFNDNRRKLLALAEQYGCDLYINGHEHNGNYPVGRAGTLSDVNCGTVTGTQGAWAMVEIHPAKAVFNVYSRAIARETADATGIAYTQLPSRLFTREIPLKPRSPHA